MAIPLILPMAFGRDPAIRQKAREAILRLFAAMPVESLPALDEKLRSWSLPSWFEGGPGDVVRMERATDADRLCIALLTCHRSGFVREAALCTIWDAPASLVMPFLLIRLGDHVVQVQKVAELKFHACVVPQNAAELVRCLGLLERMSDHLRFRQEYWTAIEAVLQLPECACHLKGGMISTSRTVRRSCYRLAATNPEFRDGEVLRLALKDSDVTVRKWAFSVDPALMGMDAVERMRLAARDPFGQIRWLAFDAFLAQHSQDDLRPFLLDRSAGLRRACQSVWGKRFGSAAEFYRSVLAERRAGVATALLGLGETGKADDASRAAEFLSSANVRTRKAALRALGAIASDAQAGELIRVVEQDAAPVAREAAQIVLIRRATTAGAVWGAAKKNGDPGLLGKVLRLMVNQGKWIQLRMYLEVAGSDDASVSAIATDMLQRWLWAFNESFSVPGKAEVDESIRLLEQCRDRLPRGMAFDLKKLLELMAR